MQMKVKDGDELTIGADTFTYRALEAGSATPQTLASTLPPAEGHAPGTFLTFSFFEALLEVFNGLRVLHPQPSFGLSFSPVYLPL